MTSVMCSRCKGDSEVCSCYTHLIPTVIVQCMHRLKARLAFYLEHNQNLTDYNLSIIPTLQYGDLLFVKVENSAELVDYLLHDELFVRFTAGIYRCQYTTKSLDNIAQQFS